MVSKGRAKQGGSRPTTPDAHLYHANNPKTPEKQIVQAPNFSSPRPYDTPIVRNEDSCKEGFLDPDAKARSKRFAKELKTWYTGPMPEDEFIEEFLPCAFATGDENMPAVEGAFENLPVSPRSEKEIYTPLVSFLVFTP